MFIAVFRRKYDGGAVQSTIMAVEHHTRKAEYATLRDFKADWAAMMKEYRVASSRVDSHPTLVGALRWMRERYAWDIYVQDLAVASFEVDETREDVNG